MTTGNRSTRDEVRRNTANVANLLWFADLPSFEKAITIGAADNLVADSLQDQFSRLSRVDLQDPAETLAQFTDSLADIVFIEYPTTAKKAPKGSVGAHAPDMLFRQGYSILKPGGSILILSDNPRWLGRIFPSLAPLTANGRMHAVARHSTSRLRRHVLRAGFSAARSFYISPTRTSPWVIIPDDAVIASLAQAFLSRGRSEPLRKGLARMGFGGILHSSRLIVGTK